MPYDPERHHRKTTRLREYDYRLVGAYFITICTHERAILFGDIIDGEMHLNAFGHIVLDTWMETALLRPGVLLDECMVMVMPNHFHAIVLLPNAPECDVVGAHSRAPSGHDATLRRAPRSLGALITGFKSSATKQINTHRATLGLPVWQRNYYDHIIRDDEGLRRIRAYIANNPVQWESDTENPSRPDRL